MPNVLDLDLKPALKMGKVIQQKLPQYQALCHQAISNGIATPRQMEGMAEHMTAIAILEMQKKEQGGTP